MKRFMFVLGAVAAFGIAANPVDAQIKFGVHGDYIVGIDQVIQRNLAGTTLVSYAPATQHIARAAMCWPICVPIRDAG